MSNVETADNTSHTTVPTFGLRYRLPALSGAWAGVELTFGIKNVFDKAPPVDMSTSFYYSTFGDPRMRRLYVNIKKTF